MMDTVYFAGGEFGEQALGLFEAAICHQADSARYHALYASFGKLVSGKMVRVTTCQPRPTEQRNPDAIEVTHSILLPDGSLAAAGLYSAHIRHVRTVMGIIRPAESSPAENKLILDVTESQAKNLYAGVLHGPEDVFRAQVAPVIAVYPSVMGNSIADTYERLISLQTISGGGQNASESKG